MTSVLNLILSHQPAAAVSNMLTHWNQCVPNENILIAYGGTKSEFYAIQHQQKFFIDDLRLRTRDHQREFQSYTRLFQAAAEFLERQGRQFQFVHFAEYDHLPLVPDLNERQIERLTAEGADVLAYHLHRVDGTNRPHFLYHVGNPAFVSYWSKITVRSDPRVVFWMFGSSSFWTREAFEAIAEIDEPFPMYLEIYLPTLAHHLGFRVCDFGEQDQFVHGLGDFSDKIESARNQGAWTLHPVKELPSPSHPR
jgi:hypothetical protein